MDFQKKKKHAARGVFDYKFCAWRPHFGFGCLGRAFTCTHSLCGRPCVVLPLTGVACAPILRALHAIQGE